MLSIDDRKSDALFKVSFTVLKQDSHFATYNVEEKHVIEYLGHLNDINIRKDIRTRQAKEKRRLKGELTYKDYQ